MKPPVEQGIRRVDRISAPIATRATCPYASATARKRSSFWYGFEKMPFVR